MNNHAEVVGHSSFGALNTAHAVLFSKGEVIDLNDLAPTATASFRKGAFFMSRTSPSSSSTFTKRLFERWTPKVLVVAILLSPLAAAIRPG